MPADIAARAIQVIAKTQHLPVESITIDQTFAELKFDSLDGMNILFAIENEFDISIPDDQAVKIKSVREMVEGIERLLAAKQAAAVQGSRSGSR
jgi:acyl carrier protein